MTQAGSIRLQRPEPITRIADIAYVRFEKPDLDVAERFLVDFGLVRVERSAKRLCMRGTGPLPCVYEAVLGPTSRYVGAAFVAASRADLDALAAATGARVEPHDARLGGGACVTLTDPAGASVTVVHGLHVRAAAESEPSAPTNTPNEKNRVNGGVRPELRPAAIVRLGHVVLQRVDFRANVDWYMRHLGLIPTDVQCLDDGAPNLAFLRCDRGATPADHHTVVVFGGIADSYGHSAYEVADIDALGMGQQVLKAGGWKHLWGIGRHLLGSQLFDYWRDPWGDEMEHYADGDVFDASVPTGYHPFDPELLWQWGQDLPADFGPQLTLSTLVDVARELWSGRLSLDRLQRLKSIASQAPRPWLRRR